MKRIKQRVKLVLGLAVAAAALLQLTNPARTNPPVEPGRDLFAASDPPPERVTMLLRAACYDCHSNETEWPWYSRIAPVSWWVVDHVNEGRQHINFSDWPHDRAKRARSNFKNVADEIESGRMPLKSFTLAHPEARLTEADRDLMVQWATEQADLLKAAASEE